MSRATDALSQSDIDAMLKGAAPAEPALASRGSDAYLYDFRRPRRIPNERLHSLEAIYSRFGLSLQVLLTSRLREATDVAIASVEQALFSEYVFSLANPCAAFVFELGAGSEGQGVVDIGNDFAYHLVDRLFGGPGEGGDVSRALTTLERMVVKSIVDRALGLFAEAWKEHIPFQPVHSGFESAPEALSIAQRDEHVLVTNIEVKIGTFSGLLALCLPLVALERFLAESPSGAASSAGRRKESTEHRQLLEMVVRGSTLEVTARLPVFSLAMREVAQLSVNQILHTGLPVDAPVEVQIDGRPRFLGAPGRSRNSLGVRITDTFVDLSPAPLHAAPRGRLA
jgi:flagellar motor switch protein FliM